MARSVNRCIRKTPETRNLYLVDTNFLANKYINPKHVSDPGEQYRIERAREYWKIIDKQLKDELARIYVLDVCIAETFRVLAKKYYNNEQVFSSAASYKYAREKLQADLHLSSKRARSSVRSIKYHDIQTNRDIIISVDRFFEKASKQYKSVSAVDLLILATSKYLIDFFEVARSDLFILTQDRPLYRLARSYQDLPSAFNPSEDADHADKVFVST